MIKTATKAVIKDSLKILNSLLDILFPIECLVCGTEGPDICQACIIEFKWPKRQHYPWIFSMWNYRDPKVEKIMRHIKNMPNARAAEIIAQIFSERILNRPKDASAWVFIPIPVGKKRLRTRGYNQAELLAKQLGAKFSFPVVMDVLVKIKNTKKQGMTKSKEERIANAVGSFGINNLETIAYKNIIIVDDITTTGSTLAEAHKTLIDAGAINVMAWTVAN